MYDPKQQNCYNQLSSTKVRSVELRNGIQYAVGHIVARSSTKVRSVELRNVGSYTYGNGDTIPQRKCEAWSFAMQTGTR